jgi:hypothetical protein
MCNGVSQLGFFEGTGVKIVRDSAMQKTPIYTENNLLHLLITYDNPVLKKDAYLTIGEGDNKSAYVITSVDRYSTPGIAYVSLDPSPLRDESGAPTRAPEEQAEDFFWLNGGMV